MYSTVYGSILGPLAVGFPAQTSDESFVVFVTEHILLVGKCVHTHRNNMFAE